MRQILTTGVLALALTSLSFADTSSVNKSVKVSANTSGGDVSSVNGSVHVGESAVVRTVESVNGSVTLEDNARADAVSSVNGSIRLGSDVFIDGDLGSVNGSLSSRSGLHVAGEVTTVNGSISLVDAQVEKNLETHNGNIDLAGNTVIAGDIHIRKSRNGWSWGSKKQKPSILEIGPNVTVLGDIHIERPVELRIDDSATIGNIHAEDESHIQRLR